MKKVLLLSIILFCTSLVATNTIDYNPIEMAILKSDPVALKKELDALNAQSKQLSQRDQLKYLALGNEILTRRGNILEWPYPCYVYMDRYLSHDNHPSYTMSHIKQFVGLCGIFTVIGIGSICIEAAQSHIEGLLCLGSLPVLCAPFVYLFARGAAEWENNNKLPSTLYERSLKVRQMLFDIQEIY